MSRGLGDVYKRQDTRYQVQFVNDEKVEPKVYSGDTLMKAGLLVPNPWGDFRSVLIELKAV